MRLPPWVIHAQRPRGAVSTRPRSGTLRLVSFIGIAQSSRAFGGQPALLVASEAAVVAEGVTHVNCCTPCMLIGRLRAGRRGGSETKQEGGRKDGRRFCGHRKSSARRQQWLFPSFKAGNAMCNDLDHSRLVQRIVRMRPGFLNPARQGRLRVLAV